MTRCNSVLEIYVKLFHKVEPLAGLRGKSSVTNVGLLIRIHRLHPFSIHGSGCGIYDIERIQFKLTKRQQ